MTQERVLIDDSIFNLKVVLFILSLSSSWIASSLSFSKNHGKAACERDGDSYAART